MTQPTLNNRSFIHDGRIVEDDIKTGGSFLTRALLQTLPTVYEHSYAPLWTLEGNLAVPVAGSLAGYTEKVEELQYQAKGEVKEYVDTTSDIPTLKSAYGSRTFNVHTFTIATEYSLQELAAFEVQPQKLSKELTAVDLRLRQSIHQLLCFGSAPRGSTGLFNDANITVDSGGYTPLTATWQQHIDFFSDKISDIEISNVLSNTTRVGKILIPAKLYSILARTRQSGDSSMSVMQALRMDYPSILWERLNECSALVLERFGVKAPGANLDRIVFCPENNANQMDRLADSPNNMPSQWKDMTYRTVFFMRSSQTMVHMPAEFLYFDIPTVS